MLVVSHGHYDHTGGIFHVLQHARKEIPVYAHPGIFQPRYSITGEQRRFAGIPHKQELLTALGAEWRFVDKPTEIIPGLWVSGHIPRNTEYETARFTVQRMYQNAAVFAIVAILGTFRFCNFQIPLGAIWYEEWNDREE